MGDARDNIELSVAKSDRCKLDGDTALGLNKAKECIEMYVPDNFLMNDSEEIHGLIHANPFAILVSHSSEAGMVATHLPTVFKPDIGTHGAIEAQRRYGTGGQRRQSVHPAEGCRVDR